MKKLYLLISIFSLIIFFNCNSKDEMQSPEIEYFDFDSSINTNQLIKLSLGSFSSEGSTEITKQAEHYEISEITYEEMGLVYNYKPNSSFIGTEYVEITKSSSIGDNNINQKTIFRINIRVTTD
jgi:hypothetical protein